MNCQGIITKGIGGFYYIQANEGIYECKARGIFRKNNISPLAGDYCEIQVLPDFKGNIEKIMPRKNFFVRPPIANIDCMFIVFSVATPSPVPELVDKLSVIALKQNTTPYIIINKTDLSSEDSVDYSDVYIKAGFKVFCVSAITSEGVDELIDFMQGKISVFTGCSGVGKSSILNCILPDRELKTGNVSEKIGRGKHTTREVELIPVNGGYIGDSPGFSSLEISGITAIELQQYFPEFEKYIGSCRFRGCSHVNEPDCSIKNAVASGLIAKSRYDSYTLLYNQLKEIKEWDK